MIVIRFHICLSLAAQPRPPLVRFGEGGTGCCSKTRGLGCLGCSSAAVSRQLVTPPAARKTGFGTGSIVPVGSPGGSDASTLKGELSKQRYVTEATQDLLSHLGFSEMTTAKSFHSFMCF